MKWIRLTPQSTGTDAGFAGGR